MGKGLPRSMARGSAQKAAIRKQRIVINHDVVVSATSTAVGWGTKVIGDFPEGNILVLGVACNLKLSGSGSDANLTATWDGDFSIGTTPTADVTLSGTEVNLIASNALGAATAEVSPTIRAVTAATTMYDNTDGSLEINLNVLIDAANITDDTSVTLRAAGVLDILYSVMLDD